MARSTIRYRSNPDFAQAIGMHPTMVSRLRNGHRSPSLSTFRAIVNALGLTSREAVEGLDACEEGGDRQAAWFAKYVAPGGPGQTSDR